MTRITLTLFFFFVFVLAQSQDFDFRIDPADLLVKEQTYAGFTTSFEQDERDLQIQFWKYCSGFGKVRNERIHYELKISADLSSNATGDLLLYAVATSENGASTEFQLAIDTKNLPADKLNDYQSQTKRLLKDFKKQVFLTQLEREIESLTTKSASVSGTYEKKRKTGLPATEEIASIESIKEEIEALRAQQKAVLRK